MYSCIKKTHLPKSEWALGAFLRWWPPSTLWAGLTYFYGHHRGCLNNPIFLNLGLCSAHWAHFMCHHELWPTSVSHPSSFLNSSLGLAGGNKYQKFTIPVFKVVLQKFCYSRLFSFLLFSYLSLYSLLTLVCYCSMWLCFSQGTS